MTETVRGGDSTASRDLKGKRDIATARPLALRVRCKRLQPIPAPRALPVRYAPPILCAACTCPLDAARSRRAQIWALVRAGDHRSGRLEPARADLSDRVRAAGHRSGRSTEVRAAGRRSGREIEVRAAGRRYGCSARRWLRVALGAPRARPRSRTCAGHGQMSCEWGVNWVV